MKINMEVYNVLWSSIHGIKHLSSVPHDLLLMKNYQSSKEEWNVSKEENEL